MKADQEPTPKSGPSSRISLGRTLPVALTSLPLLVFVLAFARFASSERVLSGVVVAGEPVGGLTREESERRLSERANALMQQKLTLKLAEKQEAVLVSELGVTLHVKGSARRALEVGRSGAVWENAWVYLRSFFAKTSVPGDVQVDRERGFKTLGKLSPKFEADPPFPGGLAIEGSTARLLPARSGHVLNVEYAIGRFRHEVAEGRLTEPVELQLSLQSPHLSETSLQRALELANRLLSGPVTLEQDQRRLVIEPAELSGVLTTQVGGVYYNELQLTIDEARLDTWLSARRDTLEAPAHNAAFEISSKDEVRVTPSEAGFKLVTAEVARAILDAGSGPNHRGILPLRREPEPKLTTEQAQQLRITKLVASFTTRHDCCQPRVENIHRIATLLDGLVVQPGQTVSINAIVGPRTQKNGFVLAPSIEDGEMVDSVGGGVSQFATTIFNALFHGGYDIIERQPHTYWFTRYPMGHDATLGFPHPDIVFKNDTAAGLLIKTSFTDKTITVKLYGDNGGRRVTSAVSERRDIVQPVVELLPNRAVPPDEEKVKEGGMIGWSVIASRTVTFPDGTKKEEKRKVTYKPKPRRVEVHPCRIPKGEPGATGEKCPEIEPETRDEAGTTEPAP